MCYDYTSYVQTITNDPNKPILADIIAYGFSNRTEVYVIISVYCVPEAIRSVEQHQNYSLFYKGIEYTSVFPLKSFYPFHSVMKYVLPSMLPLFRKIPHSQFYGSFQVTLVNNIQHRVMKDISVCLRPTGPSVRHTTICAYISQYNSVPEIHHWLAYYDYMKIDKIYLYDTDNYYTLRRSIEKSPIRKKVQFVNWQFPQNHLENNLPRQLNHQYAQADSCFYRNKYASRYVMLCDVDEYFYVNSTTIATSFLPSIKQWVSEYPHINAFLAKSNMMMGKTQSWVPREDYIKEGKLFTYFRYNLPEIYSGRIKMILLSSFDGIFGLHDCFECSWICPTDDIIRLAHYKQKVQKRAKQENVIMPSYQNLVLSRRNHLFGY